jgi:hypothetical protein
MRGITWTLLILTILGCILLEFLTYFANAGYFLLYLNVLVLAFLKIPNRRKKTIGSMLIFVLGAGFVIWFNGTVNPSSLLLFSFPLLFPAIVWQVTYWQAILLYFMPSVLLFIFFAYLLFKWFKGIRGTWFFLGASLASIFYAGWSLIEIARLYYANVGWALPNINIEGYSFPAIYTFSLFRSIFFATFFTILGHLNNIGILGKIAAKFSRFRKKKEKRLTDFS